MKKSKKNIILYMLAILLIIISQYTDIESIITKNSFEEENVIELENNYENFVKVHVSKIIDGDTIEIVKDSKKYKLRLIGIDTPEYTSKIEYYGKEATEYTKSVLMDTDIYIEKDISETDKYGRLLRYVWLDIPVDFSVKEIQSKMFNGILLINGYASQATYPPDVKYSKEFKELANNARENNKGLWNFE